MPSVFDAATGQSGSGTYTQSSGVGEGHTGFGGSLDWVDVHGVLHFADESCVAVFQANVALMGVKNRGSGNHHDHGETGLSQGHGFVVRAQLDALELGLVERLALEFLSKLGTFCHHVGYLEGFETDGRKELGDVDVFGRRTTTQHAVRGSHALHVEAVDVGLDVSGQQSYRVAGFERHVVQEQGHRDPGIAGESLVDAQHRGQCYLVGLLRCA